MELADALNVMDNVFVKHTGPMSEYPILLDASQTIRAACGIAPTEPATEEPVANGNGNRAQRRADARKATPRKATAGKR